MKGRGRREGGERGEREGREGEGSGREERRRVGEGGSIYDTKALIRKSISFRED